MRWSYWMLGFALGIASGCSPDTAEETQGSDIGNSAGQGAVQVPAQVPPATNPAGGPSSPPNQDPPPQPSPPEPAPPPTSNPPPTQEPTQSDPCKGITCSGHGTCFPLFIFPLCLCEDGFRMQGKECVPDPTSGSGASVGTVEDAIRICLEEINRLRQTANAAPLSAWTDAQSCANEQAQSDQTNRAAHGAFGRCHEAAQNECPGWLGWRGDPVSVVRGCLQAMWDEGPWGGHRQNMQSGFYTKVACGVYRDAQGRVTAVQDFR